MKKRPGRRFRLRQPPCGILRHPVARKALCRHAGERPLRIRRAVKHGNGHRPKNLCPALPARQLHQIVGAHQPDKPATRKAPDQPFKRVGGIIRAAEPVFDIGDADALVSGRDLPRLPQALGEWRHARDRFQRVLRRHHPPHFVEIEMLQCGEAEMQVAAMRRVERSAQQPDPAMPGRSNTLTDPALGAGSPLSRIAGEGAERSEAGEGQGRT